MNKKSTTDKTSPGKNDVSFKEALEQLIKQHDKIKEISVIFMEEDDIMANFKGSLTFACYCAKWMDKFADTKMSAHEL